VERDRALARGRKAADRCLIDTNIVLAPLPAGSSRLCRPAAEGLDYVLKRQVGSVAQCTAASDRGAATRWTPHCPRSSRELSGDSNARA
jgi:hypothetical protein